MISSKENRQLLILYILMLGIPSILGAGLYLTFFTINWTNIKTAFETVQSLATILAIIFGGIWTYYNFIKGKIYQPRLEPKISGRIINKGGVDYLVVIAQLKNVGITSVDLDSGCAITVFSYQPAPAAPSSVNDAFIKKLAVLPVFTGDTSIVVGATNEDQRLLELPAKGDVAFRIQLRVVYNGMESNTGTVIEYPAKTESPELTVHVKGVKKS
jgi:hypothetical protein